MEQSTNGKSNLSSKLNSKKIMEDRDDSDNDADITDVSSTEESDLEESDASGEDTENENLKSEIQNESDSSDDDVEEDERKSENEDGLTSDEDQSMESDDDGSEITDESEKESSEKSDDESKSSEDLENRQDSPLSDISQENDAASYKNVGKVNGENNSNRKNSKSYTSNEVSEGHSETSEDTDSVDSEDDNEPETRNANHPAASKTTTKTLQKSQTIFKKSGKPETKIIKVTRKEEDSEDSASSDESSEESQSNSDSDFSSKSQSKPTNKKRMQGKSFNDLTSSSNKNQQTIGSIIELKNRTKVDFRENENSNFKKNGKSESSENSEEDSDTSGSSEKSNSSKDELQSEFKTKVHERDTMQRLPKDIPRMKGGRSTTKKLHEEDSETTDDSAGTNERCENIQEKIYSKCKSNKKSKIGTLSKEKSADTANKGNKINNKAESIEDSDSTSDDTQQSTESTQKRCKIRKSSHKEKPIIERVAKPRSVNAESLEKPNKLSSKKSKSNKKYISDESIEKCKGTSKKNPTRRKFSTTSDSSDDTEEDSSSDDVFEELVVSDEGKNQRYTSNKLSKKGDVFVFTRRCKGNQNSSNTNKRSEDLEYDMTDGPIDASTSTGTKKNKETNVSKVIEGPNCVPPIPPQQPPPPPPPKIDEREKASQLTLKPNTPKEVKGKEKSFQEELDNAVKKRNIDTSTRNNESSKKDPLPVSGVSRECEHLLLKELIFANEVNKDDPHTTTKKLKDKIGTWKPISGSELTNKEKEKILDFHTSLMKEILAGYKLRPVNSRRRSQLPHEPDLTSILKDAISLRDRAMNQDSSSESDDSAIGNNNDEWDDIEQTMLRKTDEIVCI